MEEFLIRATLAGIGTAAAAAPLGCFIVWRRMAYFGDATAHAALLGVTLGLATGLPVAFGVVLAALGMGVLLIALTRPDLSSDTALGVISHGALAFALVGLAFLPDVRVDLLGYLFGDILSVSWADVALVWLGAAAVMVLLATVWRGLLLSTLNEDLARAAGVSPLRRHLVLTVTLAILVAIALQLVGALLITAFLILPAAAARAFARTPEVMVALAFLCGTLATLGGLSLSWVQDTPAGPSIVVVAAVLFALATAAARARTYLA